MDKIRVEKMLQLIFFKTKDEMDKIRVEKMLQLIFFKTKDEMDKIRVEKVKETNREKRKHTGRRF